MRSAWISLVSGPQSGPAAGGTPCGSLVFPWFLAPSPGPRREAPHADRFYFLGFRPRLTLNATFVENSLPLAAMCFVQPSFLVGESIKLHPGMSIIRLTMSKSAGEDDTFAFTPPPAFKVIKTTAINPFWVGDTSVFPKPNVSASASLTNPIRQVTRHGNKTKSAVTNPSRETVN